MNRVLTVALVSFFMLFAGVVYAEKIVIRHAMGEVIAIDVASRSLAVKKKSMDVVFVIDEKTVVKAGRDKKEVSDIKIGDRVVVKYFEKDGVKTTSTIEIKPLKPLPAAAGAIVK